MQVEQEYTCPHCWQQNALLLDVSVPDQTFIQDCEVCCNPIEFSYRCELGEVVEFNYNPLNG